MAQGIDVFEPFLALFVKFPAVALRVLPPIPPAQPCGGSELPFEDVVFKLIALGFVKAGEPGAHVAYHIVRLPAALHHRIGRAYERGQRLEENIAALSAKKRHIVKPAKAFKACPVILKAPGTNSYITPAAAGSAYKLKAERRRHFAVLGHAAGTVQAQGPVVTIIFFVTVGEHVPGKKAHTAGPSALPLFY